MLSNEYIEDCMASEAYMVTKSFCIHSPDVQEMLFFLTYQSERGDEPYFVGIRYVSTVTDLYTLSHKGFKFSANEIKLVVDEARNVWYDFINKGWIPTSPKDKNNG
ncbi:MAG: hypothetical protein EBU08_13825 [Micrococcales bacterium]|nr:hypothetical protein [Micrococcales bacterium]